MCDKCNDRQDLNLKCPTCCEFKSKSELQRLGEIFETLVPVAFVSCIIILECFVAIYKAPYVFFRLGDCVGNFQSVVQRYYILEVVVVVVCVWVLFYKVVSEVEKLKNSNGKPIRRTALFEITILFAIAMCVSNVCLEIFKMTGVSVQTPDFVVKIPDWYQMFEFLRASVEEEFIFRVLCIGIPALIIVLIIEKGDVPLLRYLAGGFGVNKFVLPLIFFSSLAFGIAHIEGWGEWKFYTTFIHGLMFGYLFVKYGFYASVSLHFLIDYMKAVYWLLGDLAGNLLLLMTMIVCAVPCICFVGRYFSKTLQKRDFTT